jgi:DNA-binding NarL/FixJ family response regulator
MSLLDELIPLGSRKDLSWLLVESERMQRFSIKGSLSELGFINVVEVSDYTSALERLSEQKFFYVLFDAAPKVGTPILFLQELLQKDPRLICIPSCYNPQADAVFDLIIAGARGFLCKPITGESVEEALTLATRTDQIPPIIKNATSRNEALAAMLMLALNKVSTSLREAKTNTGDLGNVKTHLEGLRTASVLAKTFAEGGTDLFIHDLADFLVLQSSASERALKKFLSDKSNS